jgi:hypothetical protein
MKPRPNSRPGRRKTDRARRAFGIPELSRRLPRRFGTESIKADYPIQERYEIAAIGGILLPNSSTAVISLNNLKRRTAAVQGNQTAVMCK